LAQNKWKYIIGLTAILMISCAQAADVALDIGHSIKKPGATSNSGAKEFDLNIALANAVATYLQKQGVSTHLIGEDGKMDVLTNRTLAAKEDALFLSIHHDSILQSWMLRVQDYSGFSVFVSRKNKQVAASLSCASKIGAALIKAGFKPSRYHALPVEGQNRPFADEANGVHYFDDLIVLKTAKQPAVLVEAGVIVNAEDEARVSSTEGRQRHSAAISAAVTACMLDLKVAELKERIKEDNKKH
jgi:N-acetylmuramoyl-L-alanine amidase